MRAIVATLLIVSSFFSAYALSAAANHGELYWVARKNLIPGATISITHLGARSVTLQESKSAYLRANEAPADLIVVRPVAAGELIPRSALSANRSFFERVAVPISVQASDLPQNLFAGELVNVYQVGDPRLTSTNLPPTLILSKIYILGIDRKAENLGSNASLTLSVKSSDVLDLLRATSAGRLVVVRVNG